MASIGKKILSAFVEVTGDETPVATAGEKNNYSTPLVSGQKTQAPGTEKFNSYFSKLFSDSNLPGPDYYEFAKMTQAMATIADEKARYAAAFAGLSVQGLDKATLLTTASRYLEILEADATSFHSSVDAALNEKVEAKKQEMAQKQQRIQQLHREISDLEHQVQLLQMEVSENEEKIENNTGGYQLAAAAMKNDILADIEKIKQYID